MKESEKQRKTTETPAKARAKRLGSFGAVAGENQPDANSPVPLCHSLVTELVNRCLGDCLDKVSEDMLDTIVCKLRQCLLEELEGCDVPAKSAGFSIPAVVAATSRELRLTMGPKKAIERALLLQRNKDYRVITKTLKKHLLSVQRSLVTVLLNNLLSLGRVGLLCCFILPEEDSEEAVACGSGSDGKVLDKQLLLPTPTARRIPCEIR